MADLERLRGIVGRLSKLNNNGSPKDVSGMDLEKLVAEVEYLSQNIRVGKSPEDSLSKILKRLEAVESKLGGNSGTRGSNSLEILVGSIESVSLSLASKLGQPSAQTLAKSQEQPKEEPKSVSIEQPKEVPKEEPKEQPKEQPKEESKPKEEPKEQPKEEPKEVPKEQPKEQPKEESKEQPKEESKEEPKEVPKEEKNKSNEVIFSGEMEKLGGGLLKKWQKRKFELKAETLEWTAEPEKEPRNKLNFSEIIKVEALPETKFKRKGVIEIQTKKKHYYVQAQDDATHTLWLFHLKKAASHS